MNDQAAAKVEIVGPGYLFRIHSDDSLLVQADNEGNIEYGPDYDPDEAARQFWSTLADVPIIREALLKRFIPQG